MGFSDLEIDEAIAEAASHGLPLDREAAPHFLAARRRTEAAVMVGPRLVTTAYDAARFRLSELETPMGWRLGDVIARLVLDSGAVRPAPVADPSGNTNGDNQ